MFSTGLDKMIISAINKKMVFLIYENITRNKKYIEYS